MSVTLARIREELRAAAREEKAVGLRRFFKTGPGEYGEGDRFIGVMVPESRIVARRHRDAPEKDIAALLASPIHEERLVALLILVERFGASDEAGKRRVVAFYLRHLDRANNWDLIDLSAPRILGAWLAGRRRRIPAALIRSRVLWRRRAAIVATLAFIVDGRFSETFRVADALLADPHDLIHKSAGWMLREVGKRDKRALVAWLRPRHRTMPRTMLRYAIERFPERERKAFLAGTAR